MTTRPAPSQWHVAAFVRAVTVPFVVGVATPIAAEQWAESSRAGSSTSWVDCLVLIPLALVIAGAIAEPCPAATMG